jgi:hypothetical protein
MLNKVKKSNFETCSAKDKSASLFVSANLKIEQQLKNEWEVFCV